MARLLNVISATVAVGVLAVLAIGFAVSVKFVQGVSHVEPCLPFIEAYCEGKVRGSFNEFIRSTFPLGADAKEAVALMTREGFRVSTSEDSLKLTWDRVGGGCRVIYLISVRQDDDGRIAEINGQLNPICL